MDGKEYLEKTKTPLEDFREEIKNWVEGEMRKKKEWEERGRKGEAYNPHADFINPEHLAESDRIFWEKFRQKKLNLADFKNYDAELDRESSSERLKTRSNFRAMVANKMISFLAEVAQKNYEKHN